MATSAYFAFAGFYLNGLILSLMVISGALEMLSAIQQVFSAA